MFNKLLGFISIQRKIEKKLLQLAFIPSKYFEALYVECGTKIPCHTLDICEVEEKQIRSELLKLMKEGVVDTKIELEKFQLFERINSVFLKSKDVRHHMTENIKGLDEKDYNRLVLLLKDVSQAGKLLFSAMKAFYDNYTLANEKIEALEKSCNKIIDGLFKFKYCENNTEEDCIYSFDKPEVMIGDAIRTTLQEMINVGEKIKFIINEFSYYHHSHKKKQLLMTKRRKRMRRK